MRPTNLLKSTACLAPLMPLIRWIGCVGFSMFLSMTAYGQSAWSVVALNDLNTSQDEVLIGWDGQTMFYKRIPRTDRQLQSSSWFLNPGADFAAERTAGWTGFSVASPVQLRTFSESHWPGLGDIQHVSIDAERGTLVLSALQPSGDFDLFLSQRSGSHWSVPLPLTELNSSGDEVFPNFNDGTLVFASNGHGGLGGFDVFESSRVEMFRTLSPLPSPINSAADELAVVPAGSTETAGYYVAAARMGSAGVDLWWMAPPAQQSTGLRRQVALEFMHQRTPLEHIKVIVQERGGGHVFSGSANNKGRVQLGEIQLDAAMRVHVQSNRLIKSIPDGAVCHVFEACESGQCPDEYWPGWRRVRSYRLEGGEAFVFDMLPLDALSRWPRPSNEDASSWSQVSASCEVYFERSSFELTGVERARLDGWLQDLGWGAGSAEHMPLGSFHIRGYTDPTGSESNNITLSMDRAESAAKFLMSRGVSEQMIVLQGLGATELLNTFEDSRRVELEWIPLWENPKRMK